MVVSATAVRAQSPKPGMADVRSSVRRLSRIIAWPPSAPTAAIAAAIVLLFCTAAAQASTFAAVTFRLGAFMAGTVLLALVLGMVIQEHRASVQRARWNLELDHMLSEATRELRVRVEELTAYADAARRTRVADGVVDILMSRGPQPHDAGRHAAGNHEIEAGEMRSVSAGGDDTRKDDRSREPRRGAQTAALMPVSRLAEQVQRVIRTYPSPALYPWQAFERVVGEEIERSRSLMLVFSIIEVRMEDYATARADAHDRDLALRRVVDLLRASLRRVDILSYDNAGRFAVLLPRVPKVRALETARELVSRLETDDVATGLLRCPRLTLSAGVVSFPEDGGKAAELLAGIEAVLLRTRRSGRPCWDR